MSAAEYNQIRRIIFCTVHNPKKGFSVAKEYLDTTYKYKLPHKSYVGLKAELNFYEKYQKEFALTPAGDMGEHADFAGKMGKEIARFDVTTNLDYKKFADYEPHMGNGPTYKIALLDQNNFEIIDVFDLAFQRCPSCGGHLIPCITLLGENYNHHGESQWSNDQALINVCTSCHEISEKRRFTHSGLFGISDYFNDMDQLFDQKQALQATQKYTVDTYKYFRREFDEHLMAVAEHIYKVTGRKGDGHWAINFAFKNNAIAESLPTDITCSYDLFN